MKNSILKTALLFSVLLCGSTGARTVEQRHERALDGGVGAGEDDGRRDPDRMDRAAAGRPDAEVLGLGGAAGPVGRWPGVRVDGDLHGCEHPLAGGQAGRGQRQRRPQRHR